jgi:hypothetical protein
MVPHESALPHPRRLVDRCPDPDVSSAAADIAAHGMVNIEIGGTRFLFKQRNGGHDLAGLAIATLNDVQFFPCSFDRTSCHA